MADHIPIHDTGPMPMIYEGLDKEAGSIFFAAVSTTRMPMIVTDPKQADNPIVFANPAFLRMTGYTYDELLGRNCRLLQGPATDQATIAAVRDAVAAEREIATEILNYRKDGSTFWNALFVSPVYDRNGNVIYFFASQLDISRRRDAEEALRQAQKMEALGQLTGGVAHDFNNLLQIMMGYVEVIEAGLSRPQIDTARLLGLAGRTRGAIQRASKLTSQLLAFSRKQSLQGRVLNPNEVIRNLHEMLVRALGADVRLDLRLAAEVRNARLDPTQIEVALLNIALNARDAMVGSPEKTLIVRTRNAATDEIASQGDLAGRGGDFIAIDVVDTGSGMPPEVLAHVLNPFFTTKEEGKGTGLGLSMVYGFVRQSGGTVAIQSALQQGTTVTLYFPVTEAPADQDTGQSQRAARTAGRRGHERVLVVDDRADLADIAKTMLESHGYDVVALSDAQEALAVLERDGNFALLFSDVVMPGNLNGVALARRAQALRPDLKVLLTTGYAESSIERTDARGTAYDVIDKPYAMVDLLRKVRIVLEGPNGIS